MTGAGPSWSGVRGKVALVTGGASGIGEAIACVLAEAGAHVVVADIDRAGAERVSDALRAEGHQASALYLDVAAIDSFGGFVASMQELAGDADILVNNAAIGGGEPFAEVTPARYDQVFSVSARGTFFLTQALLAGMKRKGGGRIVNVSSLIAARGASGNPHYAGAKAAMLGFTRAWAVELAPFGISVNAVLPGLTHTRMAYDALGDDALRARARSVPAGRLGTPCDSARCVLFLCDESMGFLTGQAISPNGGDFVGAI